MTPFDQLVCRIQFKQLRYEGMFTPPTLQGSLAFTGNHGGINWGGVSVDLQRGIMVMNSNRLPYTLQVYTRQKMDELGVVSVFDGKSKTPATWRRRAWPTAPARSRGCRRSTPRAWHRRGATSPVWTCARSR